MRVAERFPTLAARWTATAAAYRVAIGGLIAGAASAAAWWDTGGPAVAGFANWFLTPLVLLYLVGGVALWLLLGERARAAGDRFWWPFAALVAAALVLQAATLLFAMAPARTSGAFAWWQIQQAAEFLTRVSAAAGVALALRAWGARVPVSLALGLAAYPFATLALTRAAAAWTTLGLDPEAGFGLSGALRVLVPVYFGALALRAHALAGAPNPRLARGARVVLLSLLVLGVARAIGVLVGGVAAASIGTSEWVAFDQLRLFLADGAFLMVALALVLTPSAAAAAKPPEPLVEAL